MRLCGADKARFLSRGARCGKAWYIMTLLVLAAGMGSRYGGLKQIDPLGPGGQIILDYSIYDAWRAGFRRVVFIIKPELQARVSMKGRRPSAFSRPS